MASAPYMVYAILILVITPVIMAALGSTFSDPKFEDPDNFSEDSGILAGIANFFGNLGSFSFFGIEITIFGGTFDFLENMFLGYDLFPAWINIILVFVPIFLLMRGIISTSG